jgi:organic radical activating enzyme|tara:strand:+ start:828 stop:1706 length:879 start_codon:yes stop_codon:yes gene_type:complete
MTENIGLAEFYITNVCNLACENCNRFNNFPRKGHIMFDEEQYIEWAKKFNFGLISIIGGEPLLHPGILSYVIGLRQLWPDTGMIITSNGFQINKVKNLYQTCLDNNCGVEISFHDKDDLDVRLWEEIDKFKAASGSAWKEIETEIVHHVGRDGEKFTTESRTMEDDNGFKFLFTDAHFFATTSIKNFDGTTPMPHNSNPEKAYHDCSLKFSHTFFDGELYKCGFIAAGKEFVKSRGAEEHWKKLFDYQPITMDTLDDNWRDRFFAAEDVCSLCSEYAQYGKCITSLKKEYKQ